MEGSPGLMKRDCATPPADAPTQLPLLLQHCQDHNPESFADKKMLTVLLTAWLQVQVAEAAAVVQGHQCMVCH